MGDNQIGDEGVQHLAAMLRFNTSLKRLGLADNAIGRAGAARLLDAMRSNTSVEKLCVFGNPFLTPPPSGSAPGEYDSELHDEMKRVGTINLATRN